MRFFNILLLFVTVAVCGQAQGQSRHYKFRIYLKDKGDIGYSTDDPSAFLTKRAIERKERQKVVIDESDFPLSADYFMQVQQTGGRVVAHSKWLKTMTVQMDDSLSVSRLTALPFVDSVKYVWQGRDRTTHPQVRPRLAGFHQAGSEPDEDLFGYTGLQFQLHNADKMALAGFRAKGITVGVIDAGFTNFDVIPYFKTVNHRDFISIVPEGDIFAASDHGTKVLSTMATNLPGLFMGSAPDASYWLLRSEDVNSEYPVEEDYWVRAIEYADSLGLDLINTSLGYHLFDDGQLNYSHADLTGTTSIISLAADIAFEKGMLVVVSAGNEGDKPWRKPTPPADAKRVLSVGAIGTDSVIASFSSHGVMADGRFKPDLVSVGRGTLTIGQDGAIGVTNGTSLSSPFLAGLAASLWSINPSLHREELVTIIKRSCDRYAAPDSLYGYGIPDFQKAMRKVLQTLDTHEKRVDEKGWSIRPDSSGQYLVQLVEPPFKPANYSFRLLDESGMLISEYSFGENERVALLLSAPLRRANSVIHFVMESPHEQTTFRIRL